MVQLVWNYILNNSSLKTGSSHRHDGTGIVVVGAAGCQMTNSGGASGDSVGTVATPGF